MAVGQNTVATVWLTQWQWSNSDEYGWKLHVNLLWTNHTNTSKDCTTLFIFMNIISVKRCKYKRLVCYILQDMRCQCHEYLPSGLPDAITHEETTKSFTIITVSDIDWRLVEVWTVFRPTYIFYFDASLSSQLGLEFMNISLMPEAHQFARR